MTKTRSKQVRKKLGPNASSSPRVSPAAIAGPEWMILEVLPVIPPDLASAGAARRRTFRDV